MELRVEVADAASLRGRFTAAVALGKITGWRCAGNCLVTTVAGTDVVFDALLDTQPAQAPQLEPRQILVYRTDTDTHVDKLSDAITRLELALRNKFVSPRPDAEPVDDYGVVIAEFVIRV